MRVKVIGNSCTWFKRPNTSFVLDETILFDAPQGSLKFMLDNVDFEKIKYIVITHFHSDHFAELHLFYDMLKNRQNTEKVIVIGPKTLRKRLLTIFKTFDVPRTKKKLAKTFIFKEIKAKQKVELDNYILQSYNVKHNVKTLGYTFTNKVTGEITGFTSDTAMCNSLIEIIKNSSTVFIDCSNVLISNNHLCADEVLLLKDKFPDKVFYAVHTTDVVLRKYNKILSIPKCGQEIITN